MDQSTQNEVDRLAANNVKLEPPTYCDDCLPVKHWMSVVPYVNVKLCSRHAAIDALREALNQSRTLISTLKHVDALDRMSLDAAVDVTMYKIDKALSTSQPAKPEETK